MIDITIDRNDNPPLPKPGRGFYYVDQGNYLTLDISQQDEALTLYSDSATSCIIVIIAATKHGKTTVSLAHVDSPACIASYFDHIATQDPETLQIFAQGANPPGNTTSQENAEQLNKEIDALGGVVREKKLFLLEGDPRRDNRGDFAFHISGTGNASVSNQPYTLTLPDRDPTCGGQSVYCIMRRQEVPPIEIRNAALPFTHAELVELSSIAIEYRKKPFDPTTAFVNIVNLENTEILKTWSTTPEYEAPWFSDQLKQGACFALAMSPVVNLSAPYLTHVTRRPFARLRGALLRD